MPDLGYPTISRGFGDTVSKIITKARLKPKRECGVCKKRQELLNKVFPYKNKNKNGN